MSNIFIDFTKLLKCLATLNFLIIIYMVIFKYENMHI